MSRRRVASRMPALLLAAVLAIPPGGCGTLLYPERKGQKDGRLDTGVVVLDAVGLLFFLIPGVIAFAVDFSNGTIYLPPDKEDPLLKKVKEIGDEESSRTSDSGGTPLVAIRVDADHLDPASIREIVSRRTGARFERDDPRLQVIEARSVDALPALFDAAR